MGLCAVRVAGWTVKSSSLKPFGTLQTPLTSFRRCVSASSHETKQRLHCKIIPPAVAAVHQQQQQQHEQEQQQHPAASGHTADSRQQQQLERQCQQQKQQFRDRVAFQDSIVEFHKGLLVYRSGAGRELRDLSISFQSPMVVFQNRLAEN